LLDFLLVQISCITVVDICLSWCEHVSLGANMKLATYPPLIVIIGLLVSVNFNNAATYRGRTGKNILSNKKGFHLNKNWGNYVFFLFNFFFIGIQVPRSEMFRNEQLNNFQPKKLKKLKKLKVSNAI
jgi:hypothetical protein